MFKLERQTQVYHYANKVSGGLTLENWKPVFAVDSFVHFEIWSFLALAASPCRPKTCLLG